MGKSSNRRNPESSPLQKFEVSKSWTSTHTQFLNPTWRVPAADLLNLSRYICVSNPPTSLISTTVVGFSSQRHSALKTVFNHLHRFSQSFVICTQGCSFTHQSRVPLEEDGSHNDVACCNICQGWGSPGVKF